MWMQRVVSALVVFTLVLVGRAERLTSLLGSSDKDFVFTANDLAMLVGHSSGLAPLPEKVQPFAGLNEDAVINDVDHAALIGLILGSAEPRSLPLATVKSSSPYNGEGDVSVTR